MIHPYKLRPYHNPDGVDESKVPEGWRFKYADERITPNLNAKYLGLMCCDDWHKTDMLGREPGITYIVPVAL